MKLKQAVQHDSYTAPYANPTSNHDFCSLSKPPEYTKENYRVNASRIFASDKPNGGGFVDALACSERGNSFAAFAMAAPAIYNDSSFAACTPPATRKILEAHGDVDPVMNYSGCAGCPRNHTNRETNVTTTYIVDLPKISDWVFWWAKRDNFTKQLDIPDDSPYGYVSYNNSVTGAVVHHYRVPHLGHCWPQSQRTADNTDYQNPDLLCNSYELDFTDTVIKFFENPFASGSPNDGDDDEANDDNDDNVATKVKL